MLQGKAGHKGGHRLLHVCTPRGHHHVQSPHPRDAGSSFPRFPESGSLRGSQYKSWLLSMHFLVTNRDLQPHDTHYGQRYLTEDPDGLPPNRHPLSPKPPYRFDALQENDTTLVLQLLRVPLHHLHGHRHGVSHKDSIPHSPISP